MAANAGKTPETDTDLVLLPDSYFSEADLALIETIQAAPRAPWSRIAKTLGVDATTAARRWDRLRAAGLVWVTAYPAPKLTTVAFIDIRCRPQQLDAVCAAVTALPWVFSVEETAGEYDFLLSVAAIDVPALGRAIRRDISAHPDVLATRTQIGLTLFGEGGDWTLRAMEPARRTELATPPRTKRTPYGTHARTALSPEDLTLIDALSADARLPYTALAAATALPEHTVRRRLHRLLTAGDLTLRCDFAYPHAGLPTLVTYHLQVPHPHLPTTASTLIRLPEVRMCATITGPTNLFAQVLLHSLGEIDPFESRLSTLLPHLRITTRTLTLHTPKRMGWLLDPRGRATGRVPLNFPDA